MTDKKKEIYKCAKELFESGGFKDTNISGIMKKAGFATGTFYNYYKSKDQLFMEIYIDENVKLKRSIMQTIDPKEEPLNVMREMTMKNLAGMSANPILREWYNRDVFSRIEQGFQEENGLEYVDFLYDSFIDIVKMWQEEGRMRRDINAKMIMAIFGALINVDLHKEEIGQQFFPEVMEHLAEFVMNGLTQGGESDGAADGKRL